MYGYPKIGQPTGHSLIPPAAGRTHHSPPSSSSSGIGIRVALKPDYRITPPEGNMHFTKLDDSPMFRQQIQCLEESAETLREKSLRFYKGCRKYTDGLGEGHDRDVAFASALETFGGHNDPTCVSFGALEKFKGS